MEPRKYTLIAIEGLPTIHCDDDLPAIIADTLDATMSPIRGDILVVTHKIVSIAESAVYYLEDIEVTPQAKAIAQRIGRHPKIVEAAIRESVDIIRDSNVLITQLKNGIITDMSGIDVSNAPEGYIVALPRDPDASARTISDHLSEKFGFRIPVIISDTQGRPWRKGAINTCIGLYGLNPHVLNAGKNDLYGRRIQSSLVCLADELAAAAELLMRQSNENVPLVLIRGVEYEIGESSIFDIIRSDSENLFR